MLKAQLEVCRAHYHYITHLNFPQLLLPVERLGQETGSSTSARGHPTVQSINYVKELLAGYSDNYMTMTLRCEKF
uniref:AlNc14C68G4771 protein n=1 Tax=Albugo laibachii Nc14 TaxID=890382 RepID=F0WDQ1_9STRA|nr:AlNc14C68G4771 [Albugo laibachii Nc14]|eukprot:CCA19327.1 AlNc14C68G4771 [Albugo laibachii Nc14]